MSSVLTSVTLGINRVQERGLLGRIVRNVVDDDLLGGGDNAVEIEAERLFFGEGLVGGVEMDRCGLAGAVVDDGVVGLDDALQWRRTTGRTQWSSMDQNTMWLQHDGEGVVSRGGAGEESGALRTTEETDGDAEEEADDEDDEDDEGEAKKLVKFTGWEEIFVRDKPLSSSGYSSKYRFVSVR